MRQKRKEKSIVAYRNRQHLYLKSTKIDVPSNVIRESNANVVDRIMPIIRSENQSMISAAIVNKHANQRHTWV
jgi:hypothetical protein